MKLQSSEVCFASDFEANLTSFLYTDKNFTVRAKPIIYTNGSGRIQSLTFAADIDIEIDIDIDLEKDIDIETVIEKDIDTDRIQILCFFKNFAFLKKFFHFRSNWVEIIKIPCYNYIEHLFY